MASFFWLQKYIAVPKVNKRFFLSDFDDSVTYGIEIENYSTFKILLYLLSAFTYSSVQNEVFDAHNSLFEPFCQIETNKICYANKCFEIN